MLLKNHNLTRTDRKTLDRYMTRSGAEAFLAKHLGVERGGN